MPHILSRTDANSSRLSPKEQSLPHGLPAGHLYGSADTNGAPALSPTARTRPPANTLLSRTSVGSLGSTPQAPQLEAVPCTIPSQSETSL
eukprot:7982351-Pyramimonas_sp.AAC.1